MWKVSGRTLTKKKGFRRRPVRKSAVKKLQVAVKHLKTHSTMAQAMYVDTIGGGAYTPLVIGGTCTYLATNLITQVALQNIGNQKLVYNSVDLRINFEYKVIIGGALATTYGVNTTGLLRVILLEDMANDGANPVIQGTTDSTSVLVESTAGVVNTLNYLLPRNLVNSKRYRFVHDKVYKWTTLEQSKQITIRKRWKNKIVEYDTQIGTVSDASKGQLFLILIPDDALIAYTASGTVGLAFDGITCIKFEHS